ncbi:MAG TPA: LAGLIDADG family homing endonuclease [Pyrinomonadaceae bacterium]|jgi:hypothetical protein
MTDFEIGYIMGLIVGEGSFTGDCKKGWLSIKLHMNDPAPLLEVQRLLGGRIYGPYHNNGRHFLHYKLYGRELVEAFPLFKEYLPQSRKRDQFYAWLEKYYIYFNYCVQRARGLYRIHTARIYSA